jgi:hypothetical protein
MKALAIACVIACSACGDDEHVLDDEVRARTCWEWSGGALSVIGGVASLSDGGALVVGSLEGRFALTRLSSDGDVVWTADYAGAGEYHGVVVLPSGVYVALGTTGASGTAAMRAYADDGTLLWDATGTSGKILFTDGIWWRGAERLLVRATNEAGGELSLLSFDPEGELLDEIDVSSFETLGDLAAMGDGFAVCGTKRTQTDVRWVAASYDAAGESAWTFLGNPSTSFRGCGIAGDTPDRIATTASTSDGTGNLRTIVASLVDGQAAWERVVDEAWSDRSIAIDSDGNVLVAGATIGSAWLRRFSTEGVEEVIFDDGHRAELFGTDVAVGPGRVFQVGYDRADEAPRGFVDCIDLDAP